MVGNNAVQNMQKVLDFDVVGKRGDSRLAGDVVEFQTGFNVSDHLQRDRTLVTDSRHKTNGEHFKQPRVREYEMKNERSNTDPEKEMQKNEPR